MAFTFAVPMTAERHLVFQESTLHPGGEWAPRCHGWLIARVAEGTGYWLQNGVSARQLAVGDGLVVAHNKDGVLRASQLCPLKLQFFFVQPKYLAGVLTANEWHQFETDGENLSSRISIFSAADSIGQQFARLTEKAPGGLALRCALLQLWATAVAGLLPLPPASSGINNNKLRERFRELVGRMSGIELSEHTLTGLARELHCSERHFSRLFREEFGVPLRARQIELRLQRARQLLTDPNAKIINVAYNSGYRHLGLFNAMFKKHFGVTPSEWRQQNSRKSSPAKSRGFFLNLTARAGILLAFLALNLLVPKPALADSTSTNRPAARAKLKFEVRDYLVMGNTILPPETIAQIFTNVPDAFGTNVTFDAIRTTLTDLQSAYRERGYVTVSVTLPQQKLTNATVKVQVVEGRLATINVAGNRYFSSNNVLRALPSLHTNMLLNSQVFQRELDNANISRDRQIYPVIGPGREPGTSDLTLKVKDQLPLHARVEVNNTATPGTPSLRANFNAQYDNLWDLEHQMGLQYSFSFQDFKSGNLYSVTPLDDPLIANYSAYYRLPLGGYSSVQEKVDSNPGRFGYNEVTHQFNLPPATGRPELTVYASRSTTDTGVQFGARTNVTTSPLLTIDSADSGQNITLNEGLGARFSVPLPPVLNVSSTLSFGLDFKLFRMTSFNSNNFFVSTVVTNAFGSQTNSQVVSSGQPVQRTTVDYLPFNVGLNESIADKWGTSFLNAQANFNFPIFSGDANFVPAANNRPGARAQYVTLQMGFDRVQTIYENWSVKLHADGQWASGPLISNEQFSMGGTMGVRGYTDGQASGDTGWRLSIEPQTPLINVGMVGNGGHKEPCWVRASVFMDYGRIYALDGVFGVQQEGAIFALLPNSPTHLNFWGTGFNFTANIGSHFDARVTVAWPLISEPGTSEIGDTHVYFGVGAQF